MSDNSYHQSLNNAILTLKVRFLNAVASGELGTLGESGVIVTLREFKAYFKDIKTDYINSFLPAATIEVGQHTPTRTRYVFRVRKGVYRVHPDALEAHIRQYGIQGRGPAANGGYEIEEPLLVYVA